jgi:hypothetical protein
MWKAETINRGVVLIPMHHQDRLPRFAKPDKEISIALNFDTLKLAKGLERAGLSREQAGVIVDALRESQTDRRAVESDLPLTFARLETKLDQFCNELKWWIAGTAVAVEVICLFLARP